MTDAAKLALVHGGIDTMATLAFSSSHQAGSVDDAALIQVLVDAMHPTVPSGSDKACLRRLFFESTTIMMSEMRNKVERVDEALPRRVPQPERAARYDNQAARLIGMNLVGELECAHSLLGDTAQQREDGVLKYLTPGQCPKREQELAGLKKTTGPIPKDIPATADISTELRIRSALVRRCLAYDQAGLTTYEVDLEWVDYIYAQLMRMPPDQSFQAISMQQILQADRQLFMVLSSFSRAGIAPTAAGVRPLDALHVRARTDPQVIALLQPLSVPVPRAFKSPVLKAVVKKSENRGGGKGAGKGTGKSKKRGGMPKGLEGTHSKTPAGEPICFGYNLSGCNRSGCNNKHCCCKPGCYKDHPVYEHPG